VRKERDRPHTGVAYCEGYIHGVRPFVLVITICALSDAAHSFSGRCARGCCISLHRESGGGGGGGGGTRVRKNIVIARTGRDRKRFQPRVLYII